MKYGHMHLAHKVEDATDLETGPIVGVTAGSERLELAFAHLYETGGMRRVPACGHTKILKRVLIHAGGFRIPPAAVRRDLETLAARGLLEIKVSGETLCRYGPKTDELRQYSDQLAQHYITSRHLVLNFVSTHARSSARRFADAFKLRDKDR